MKQRICALILMMCLLIMPLSMKARASESGFEMITAKGCSLYYSNSATEANKAVSLKFGTELTVTELGTNWSQVAYDGQTLYTYTSSLTYISYTVKEPVVNVTKTAGGSTSLGYAIAGAKVSSLGQITKSGVQYLYCAVDTVYDSTGATQTDTDVKGYIPMSALDRSGEDRVAKWTSSLYQYPFSSSDDESLKKAAGTLTAGEKVYSVVDYGGWSKVRYDGEYYFMYNSNLESTTKNVTAAVTVMRSLPASGASSVTKLYWNQTVTVLDTYGDWYYCCSGSYTGFVSASALGRTTRMVTLKNIKLYSSADDTSTVQATVLAGTEVQVNYVGNTWTEISYDGMTGYNYNTNFQYPVYTASGSTYSTAEDLYTGSSSGTVAQEVSLVAMDTDLDCAYVMTEDGDFYWMRSSDVKASNSRETAYVSNRWITIRTKPTTDSTSTQIPYMTEVALLGQVSFSDAGGWYKLEYDGGIWYTWIEAGETVFTDTETGYQYTSDSSYRKAVLDLASEIFLEWDTVYKLDQADGTEDSQGRHMFDCSGFVSYVLNNALQKWNPLYSVPKNTTEMYSIGYLYNEGLKGEFCARHIPLSEAQPGDVIFFDITDDDGVVDHCGLYVGNNEFLHCADYDWVSGVNLMTLNGYMDEFVGVVRFIPEKFTPADVTLYTTNNYTKLRSTNTSSYQTLRTLDKYEAVKLQWTNRFNYIYVKDSDGLGGYVLRSSLVNALSDLKVTNDPDDVSAKTGSSVSFSVSASGDGLTYQWQYSADNSGIWKNSTATGAKTQNLKVTAKAARHGYRYRCQVTDGEGYVITSAAATLSVYGIETDPKSIVVLQDKTAVFTVEAAGSDLVYQWQYRTSSTGSWKNSTVSTAKSATLKVTATSGKDGYQYRCRVKDGAGNTSYSSAATLTVATLSKQPVTRKVKSGVATTFSVTTSSADLTYQWQYRVSSSSTWKNSGATGSKTATVKVSATVSKSGYRYRCKITDDCGNVCYSNTVYLYVLGIRTQPASQYKLSGKAAEFTVSASGYQKTYQWQYRTSDSGTWKNSTLSTAKTSTLKFTTSTAKNGYQYRCKVTDGAGNVVYSNAASIYVLGITAQPGSLSVSAGSRAVFRVGATGDGLVYQWQYRTSATGSWKKSSASGYATAKLSVSATAGKNGYQYRCKITDSASNTCYSKVVTLSVK